MVSLAFVVEHPARPPIGKRPGGDAVVRWPKPAPLPQARVPYQARRLVVPQHRQPVAGPGVPGCFSRLAHISGPDGKGWIGHVEERRGLVNCDVPPLLPPACLPSAHGPTPVIHSHETEFNQMTTSS